MERWTDADFSQDRAHRPGLWAVAFLADWCPFCQEFRPEFEAREGGHPFATAIVDLTSEESSLWDTFRVEVVPTIAVFLDGRLVWRRDGKARQGLGAPDLDAMVAAADVAAQKRP